MGAFRRQGFNVVAYPVDYRVAKPEDRVAKLEDGRTVGERELLGLFGYWVTGRSDALFPGPEEKTCC
jgi:hypothetical protein